MIKQLQDQLTINVSNFNYVVVCSVQLCAHIFATIV